MGLFGNRRLKPGDTSSWQMQDGLVQGDTAVKREPGYWQGGQDFTGRDALAGVLAAVGDAFARGGQGGAMQHLMGGRKDVLDARTMAEQAQLQRQQGLEDYEAKQRIDQQYAAPATRNFEDNAGNQWSIGADGQPHLVYADPIPKMYIQGDQAVQISNPFAQGRQQPAMGGDLPEGYSIRGGAPSPAAPPFPPRLGGMPRRRR